MASYAAAMFNTLIVIASGTFGPNPMDIMRAYFYLVF
jgi:hypothetical protein